MRVGWTIGTLALAGCAATRDPAPDALDDLLGWTFQRFEDPDAMEEAVTALAAWLETEGRTEAAHAGMRLSPLTDAHVADVTTPDGAVLADARGVAAGSTSPWPMDAHVALLVEVDQTFLDPGNYPRYDRMFVGGDPDAFLAGDGVLRTLNDIERRNVGVSIPYLQNKDYRWVHTDLGSAVVARSWIEASSCSNSGDNCVLQGYAVDVFWDSGQADVVRLTTSWSELKTLVDGLLSEDQMVAVAVNGILEVYENTDAHLARLADEQATR